jgi:signal transduction histidine kinase
VKLTVTQRLSLVFAALLLLCSGTSAWIQLRASRMHELEVVQGLSRDLAASIARDTQLTDAHGLMPDAVRQLFDQLMVVNPSVEAYLVEPGGRIVGHAAPEGRLRREHIDLAPVRRLLADEPLPILGDDPRSVDGRKVFSAAPLRVGERDVGYVYVVLLGEAHDRLNARGSTHAVLTTALWSIAMVALLCLVAGLVAFTFITRPLRRLTESVRGFDVNGPPADLAPPAAVALSSRDEIAVLDSAYRQMVARIGEQWRALTRQDQERRELIANVSHDLRTPLASLHGYLETLLLKDATLDPSERRRYLQIAIDQSRKVGGLTQSLFELARLEYGFVQPDFEAFSMVDLVQDVFQKFELRADSRRVSLRAHFPPQLPAVRADLGLIERAISNLLDNALRYTPEGGQIEIILTSEGSEVRVMVADTGPGIAPDLRGTLFQRPFVVGGARREGGLGLRIVHRILELHARRIELVDLAGRGASFRFGLPVAD